MIKTFASNCTDTQSVEALRIRNLVNRKLRNITSPRREIYYVLLHVYVFIQMTKNEEINGKGNDFYLLSPGQISAMQEKLFIFFKAN